MAAVGLSFLTLRTLAGRTRITSEDWSKLSTHKWNDLRDLGLPRAAAVEVVYEGLIPPADYLSGNWRRDGLFRDRAWPLLDRATGFFALLVIGICVASLAPQIVTWWLAVLLAFFYFRVPDAAASLLFSELGPDFMLRIPHYQAKFSWGRQGLWPALMAALSMAFFVTGQYRIRRLYTGSVASAFPAWQLVNLGILQLSLVTWAVGGSKLALIVVIWLSIGVLIAWASMSSEATMTYGLISGFLLVLGYLAWVLLDLIRSAPAVPQKPAAEDWWLTFPRLSLQIWDLSDLAAVTRLILWLSWYAALAVVTIQMLRWVGAWSRRNPLLCRLPVHPRTVVRGRLKSVIVGLLLVSVSPLALEILATFVWSTSARLDGDVFARTDIFPERGWRGSLLILLIGVGILFLTQTGRWRAKAMVVIGLGGIPIMAFYFVFTQDRLAPWWLVGLTALSIAALPLLHRAMERRVATAG